MRTLPAGYLYVLKPDLTWDGYMVDSEGLFRKTPVGLMPASAAEVPPMSQACRRSADNVTAQVIAVDPVKHAAVWLAFSRYRWTPAVLADYASNKEGCRDRRMTKLDVMAAAQGSLGSEHPAKNAVRFGMSMSSDVGKAVADYSDASTVASINRHQVIPLRSRAANAQALATKMASISANTVGKTGAIILLRDDLGVAMDLNAARNSETAKLGAFLAENQHKRFVGDVITGFEKAFVENGQADEWNKRYKTKYHAQQIKTDRTQFDSKAKPWEIRINGMADDVATLNGSDALKACWRDFDPKDDVSATNRLDATAACVHGAVKTKKEQALWDAWFNESPADPYSTLWGALTGMDASFGEFMLGKGLPDTGKLGAIPDIVKNIRDAREKYHEHLAKRASDNSLALVGVAMASQIARLKAINPSLYRVAGLRVLMVVSARTKIVATPVSVAMTLTQEAVMLAEATFGPPEPIMKRLLDLESRSNKRVFVVGSNGVDAYAWTEQHTSVQKVRVVEAWLPETIAKDMPALGSPSVLKALPAPRINHFAALKEFTRSVPGALAWVGMTFQVLNLTNSAKDLLDAKTQDKTDACFGTVSGILGVLGVTAEITAGAMEKIAGRYVASAAGRMTFAGGLLASFAAITEAVQLAVKAVDRGRAGDVDAAWLYGTSSLALAISGLAGIGGSLAIASTAGALGGALGFLAPIGTAAATIPVWGWIAAGVIFLGIGLALLWKAISATDTPMEVWLLGCSYGKGKLVSRKVEMDDLNKLMYAMTIEVEWSEDAFEASNKNFYDDFDDFRFAISLPGVGGNSVIGCKVTLVGRHGRKQVFHETIRPRIAKGIPVDPHQLVVTASPSLRTQATPDFIWWSPPRISDGGKRFSGQMKLNDDIYRSAEVEIKYWPDQANLPNLVLPMASEQRTLIGSD